MCWCFHSIHQKIWGERRTFFIIFCRECNQAFKTWKENVKITNEDSVWYWWLFRKKKIILSYLFLNLSNYVKTLRVLKTIQVNIIYWNLRTVIFIRFNLFGKDGEKIVFIFLQRKFVDSLTVWWKCCNVLKNWNSFDQLQKEDCSLKKLSRKLSSYLLITSFIKFLWFCNFFTF